MRYPLALPPGFNGSRIPYSIGSDANSTYRLHYGNPGFVPSSDFRSDDGFHSYAGAPSDFRSEDAFHSYDGTSSMNANLSPYGTTIHGPPGSVLSAQLFPEKHCTRCLEREAEEEERMKEATAPEPETENGTTETEADDQRDIIGPATFRAKIREAVERLRHDVADLAEKYHIRQEDALKEAGFHQWFVQSPKGPTGGKERKALGYGAYFSYRYAQIKAAEEKENGGKVKRNKEENRDMFEERNRVVREEWMKFSDDKKAEWVKKAEKKAKDQLRTSNVNKEDFEADFELWDVTSSQRLRKQTKVDFRADFVKWVRMFRLYYLGISA